MAKIGAARGRVRESARDRRGDKDARRRDLVFRVGAQRASAACER